ncbi:hypothetical protein DXG01_014850 [Tephrocybe rancida]|nr:hypothetical protein DXG01_014850 [Tephrocybe rancida]
MVFQQLYCNQARCQLGAKEMKAKEKKERGGKLHIVAHNKAQEQAEAKKDARQQVCEEYNTAVEEWKVAEEARKVRNEDRLVAWKKAVEEWEAEKAQVKARKEKIKPWAQDNPKPKRNDKAYKVEKAIPKPKITSAVDEALEDLMGTNNDKDKDESSGSDGE